MTRRRAQTEAFNILRNWQAPKPPQKTASNNNPTPTTPPTNKTPSDQALWQQATQAVKALPNSNRAIITPPPPKRPIRRKIPATSIQKTTPAPTAPASSDDAALLRKAFADVQPLPDNKRPAPPIQKQPTKTTPPNDNNKTEETLFTRLIGNVTTLRTTARAQLQTPPPPPIPRQRRLDERAALQESLSPLNLYDTLEAGIDNAFIRPGIAQRTLKDLRRGRWIIQAELDLHGLNRDTARDALSIFLADCLTQGKRCIRIIHGKGLGSPGGRSILKELSWRWLAQRQEVLAFCQAQPRQGGQGALIVLLSAPPRP